MVSRIHISKQAAIAVGALLLLASCVHKKYENPIAKNSQQPDKVLFDRAVKDIERGRYEVARLSLNTLMNTYESSEYLAKAKLAIADSWYREGGATGWAQAEAEYKDFILFYPNMEEAAEAQNRVCDIHYKQMDRSDRDITQTLRAEDECRNLLVQFPNSKFAPEASQRLREIQESLAEHEFVVGNFYWKHDMNPAAANRLNAVVDDYPLYSKADEALFEAGDSYSRMGPRFRARAGDMFTRIVRDYPLTSRYDEARKRLEDMELPVPQTDPQALARMKFEKENYKRPSIMARATDFLRSRPDLSHAAHEGAPVMTDPKRTIPVSVPVPTGTEGDTSAKSLTTGTTDVTASTVSDRNSLDNQKDARTQSGTTQSAATPTQAPLPTNRDKELQRIMKERAKRQAALEKKSKKKNKGNEAKPSQPAVPAAAPAGQAPANDSGSAAPAQAGASGSGPAAVPQQ